MTQEEINEKYELFHIPKHAIPHYSSPQVFSEKFKKCSVLQDYNVTYSTSSKIIQNK